MAFTEADRVQIRKFVGYSAVWLQARPMLESAITTVQARSEGGDRDDNSTELEIRAMLATLQKIWDKVHGDFDCLGTVSVGKIAMDPIRARMYIAMQGRVMCGNLARILGLDEVLADAFSPAPVNSMGDSYSRYGRAG